MTITTDIEYLYILLLFCVVQTTNEDSILGAILIRGLDRTLNILYYIFSPRIVENTVTIFFHKRLK